MHIHGIPSTSHPCERANAEGDQQQNAEMYVTEHAQPRNNFPQKESETLTRDNLATIVAMRHAISVLRARVIIALAGIGSEEAQR